MPTLKPKTDLPAQRPSDHTLASVWPQWKIASDRLKSLCDREEELCYELGVLNALVGNSAPITPPVRWKSAPPKPLNEAVQKLLAGINLPAPPPSPPEEPAVFTDPDHEQRRLLTTELEAVREARAALHPVLAREHAAGSKALCDLLKPEYGVIAKRLTDAVLALGTAVVEHERFAAKHVSANRGFLRPPQLDLVADDPRDPDSRLRRFLNTAAEGGWFNLSALPDEWRKPPQVHREAPKVRKHVFEEARDRLRARRPDTRPRRQDLEAGGLG